MRRPSVGRVRGWAGGGLVCGRAAARRRLWTAGAAGGRYGRALGRADPRAVGRRCRGRRRLRGAVLDVAEVRDRVGQSRELGEQCQKLGGVVRGGAAGGGEQPGDGAQPGPGGCRPGQAPCRSRPARSKASAAAVIGPRRRPSTRCAATDSTSAVAWARSDPAAGSVTARWRSSAAAVAAVVEACCQIRVRSPGQAAAGGDAVRGPCQRRVSLWARSGRPPGSRQLNHTGRPVAVRSPGRATAYPVITAGSRSLYRSRTSRPAFSSFAR